MAISFSSSLVDYYPDKVISCDSDCKKITMFSSYVENGFFVKSTASRLFSGVQTLVNQEGCVRDDGSIVYLMTYNVFPDFTFSLVTQVALEGTLESSRFKFSRTLFGNMTDYDSSSGSMFLPPLTTSMRESIGCSLVPIADIGKPVIPPPPSYEFSYSSLILPATILASLFFVFVYKMLKRVLFR